MAVKYSSYSMIKRLSALVMLIAFFAFLIISRLCYLQVINGYSYIGKGLTEWLRDLPLIASRGKITDRNGVALAESYTTYDVYVRPADVTDFDKVALVLSSNLDISYEKVFEIITKKSLSEIKIKQDIEKTIVQKILKNYESGIFFTTNTERYYKHASMLCQILGFVGSDNVGLSGLEKYYNSYLQGIDGICLVEADLKGRTIENGLTFYEESIDGLNVALTIDFKIQNEVEKALASAMQNTGAKSVSCVVENPQTGEILACATLPSYDLNNIPTDDMQLLNSLSRAKTIVDTFEPGSTFKALVTAIALEEGLTSKGEYFYCGGFRVISGVRIRCSRRSGHGSQTLEKGLMNSCNCVFMDLIARIGVDKFYKYLDRLGFTSSIGIDFPGETAAVMMSKKTVTAPDLARMGFGQTISLTAMQMVNGFSTVVNGGRVLEPHFIKSISSVGTEIYSHGVSQRDKIFSEKTSQTMREMLLSVVNEGGGRYAQVEGYSFIGGKTGTAQKYENGMISQGKYVASFIGFAPYDNPKYVVYVVVDEPQGAYYGGVVAAPIAKSIFEKIIEFENYNKQPQNNAETFQLPTFIGLNLTDGAKQAAELGLQYLVQGEGDYVISQFPAPGTKMTKNEIVLLIME